MIKYTDIYLVDCENIGLKKLRVLNNNSLIYYFTSNMNYMSSLGDNEREIHIFHDCKKDSLDFVIDSKLGYLLCHYGKSVNFHIISLDKGYDLIVKFWQNQGYHVSRGQGCECDYNHIDKAKLKYEYAESISNFTRKDFRKLKNVYAGWFRSRAKNYEVLYNQIVRTFYSVLDKSKFETVCKYLYYIGLEEIN